MTLLYAIFFGAGVAAIAYSTLARRVGYGNQKNVAVMIGAIFVFATLVFFTIMLTLNL